MSKKPTVNLKEDKDNTQWKEKKSQKGNNYFYRRAGGRWINVGRYKTGHVYVTVDSKQVKDHNIHYTNDDQLKKDVDIMLETLVIIGE